MDEIEHRQAGGLIALRDGHDEPQVGFDEPPARRRRRRDHLGGGVRRASCFDRLRELDLFGGVEQRLASQLAQILLHEIALA